MRMKTAMAIGVIVSGGAISTAKADVAYGWIGTHNLSGTYSPLPGLSYNSAGGGITVNSTATGFYRVIFSGLGTGASSFGNAQVTALDDNSNYCSIQNFSTNGFHGSDIEVDVKCYSFSGVLTNTRFFAVFQRGRQAYVFSNSPTSPFVTSGTSHTDSTTPIAITRSSVGNYNVFLHQNFTFIDPTFTGGNVIASAYGETPNHCKISNWNGPDGVANVYCFSPSGVAADTIFLLSAGTHGAVASQGRHYGYAYNPTAGTYPPPAFPSYTEDVVSFNRIVTGAYYIYHGSPVPTSGVVMVTAVGSAPTYCKPGNWYITGGFPPIEVDVDCFNYNGTWTDERFEEQFVTAP